jgi:hypothetical protein
MGAITTDYKSGKDAVITIGTNTYAKGKVFKLPEEQASVIKVKHLGGLTTLEDGFDSYGNFEVSIPEDGAARLTNTTTNIGIAMSDGRGGTCASCFIVSDGGAQGQRGQSTDRRIVGECLVRYTPVAPTL